MVVDKKKATQHVTAAVLLNAMYRKEGIKMRIIKERMIRNAPAGLKIARNKKIENVVRPTTERGDPPEHTMRVIAMLVDIPVMQCVRESPIANAILQTEMFAQKNGTEHGKHA